MRETSGAPSYQTEEECQNKTLSQTLQISLIRPFRLLATQPIISVRTLYMSYTYGIVVLLLSRFPLLWTDPQYYNESAGIGGLNYISLGFRSLSGHLPLC